MLGFLIDVIVGTGARALGRGIGRGLASPPPGVSASTSATGVLCAACGTFRPVGRHRESITTVCRTTPTSGRFES